MTYPIQPGPFFWAVPNWGKPAKRSLPQKLSKWADVNTVRSPFSSSITPPWEKPSNLWTSWVYSRRPTVPSWIQIKWIQSASHRNNKKSPSTLAMSTATKNTAPTASHFIPGQHFLGTLTLLSPNDQTFMGDDNFPVLNQQTRLLLHNGDISPSHVQQCLNLKMHFSPGHLAVKMPSQFYNNFISFLNSFLPARLAAYQRKHFIPCCH